MPTTGTSANRIGYARVSSHGQNLDAQMYALREVGCEKIFTDKMTGAWLDRPGWERMMAYLRPGDTLVVTELSRMTRSLPDLSGLVAREHRYHNRHGTHLPIDDGRDSPNGAGAAGRGAARGKTGGRPRTDAAKLENARILYENSGKTAAAACAVAGIGRRIFFSCLAEFKKAHASGSEGAL